MQVDTVVFTDRKYESHLKFWKAQRQAFSENFVFRQKASLSSASNIERQHQQFQLTKKQLAAVYQLVKDNDTGLFVCLLSAYATLLKRYSVSEQLIINTPLLHTNGRVDPFAINRVPLLLHINDTEPLRNCLNAVQQSLKDCYRYQGFPLALIKEDIDEELFRSNVLIRYQPLHPILDVEAAEEDLIISVEREEEQFLVHFYYRPHAFSDAFIGMMHHHFIHCLASFTTLNISLRKIPLIGEEEEKSILIASRNTAVDFPKDKTIIDLFETQVTHHPERIALSFAGQTQTYQQLNERVNQLAHYLLDQGLEKEALVLICLDRSVEMIISLLAVLKAGGAYVPSDPDYPTDRLQYMLKDSQAQYILTVQQHQHHFAEQEGAKIMVLDTAATLKEQSKANPSLPIQADNLAYVIYTSGTTGKPKGVLLEHRNVVRLFVNDTPLFDFNEEDVWTLFHSYCFDFSVWEMYGALLFGGRLVIVPKEATKDMAAFEALLQYEKVTVLNQTPTAFYVLQEQVTQTHAKLPLRYVIFGGEALSPGQLIKWYEHFPHCRLINMYGITETTVHVTYKEIGMAEIQSGLSNIGLPIPTLDCFVLDEEKTLLPLSVAGELYVGGAGLARGYLNRDQLTKDRFVSNPFDPQWKRLYRSGDLVRRLPDGNLEYLGRIDDQVKIRGYRIELGEVETVLLQAPSVKYGVVLAVGEEKETKRLVAYVVPDGAFNRELVQEHLRQQLPDYMVPSILLELEDLPTTANGKVDKNALVQLDISKTLTKQYVAARNEVEEQLASIWRQLLNVEQVGIYDNFFDLGGDSITTIQVVNRARRVGIQLTPPDLFEHQTVAALAAYTSENQTLRISAEQDQLTGAAQLLPIQHWFFEKEFNHAHFNHALLLQVDKSIEHRQLELVIQSLLSHHDALRFAYRKGPEGWQQEYGNFMGTIEITDLSTTPMATLSATITDICQVYQRRLDIEQGMLARFVLMETPEQESHNRLLFVIHHLAVDGVSWRILLDDMAAALATIASGAQIELGLKSSSYREWGRALEQHARHPKVTAQQAYWQAIVADFQALPTDYAEENVQMQEVQTHSVRLGASMTSALLLEAHRAYNTQMDDLLLTALAKTFNDWSGHSKLIIGMEGHGREALFEDIDISNTVGWFTNLYPVALSADPAGALPALIKSVKEQLRRIPDKGMGYGLLRYLHPDAAVRTALAEGRWEVVFNYLGQFDQLMGDNNLVQRAKESTGNTVSPEMPFSNKFEINSAVSDGELAISWTYSTKQYRTDTVRQLAEVYLKNLEALIQHCQQQREPHWTPSDCGLAPMITHQELDHFLNTVEAGQARRQLISAIYPLSSLQEGLLFHALYDASSPVYVEQLSLGLPTGVDMVQFKKAWEYLMRNHSILRSAFYYEDLKIPVQCVYKTATLPFEVLDYSHLSAKEQALEIEAFALADQQKGFDFTQAPLMRLTLIKKGERAYHVLWTHHHILLDGWSMPLLMNELLTAYGALIKGEELTERKEDRYEDFIQYLLAQDRFAEQQFWQDYLQGFEQPSLLPFINDSQKRNKGAEHTRELNLKLDEQLTHTIRRYTQSARITVNTLVQGIWALLLAKYTGNQDTLFGVTVSGRPSNLDAAEERIGLYINTLPLRTQHQWNQSITEWLAELQKGHTAARNYQNTALNQIRKWTDISGDFFDSILVFENYPLGEVLEKKWALEIDQIHMEEKTNYLLTIIAGLGKTLDITFSYNALLLEAQYVEMIKSHFEQALRQIIDGKATTAAEVQLITAAAQAHITTKADQTAVGYPQEASIVSLFEARAQQYANRTALSFGNQQLRYQQLNQRANQVAHYLLNFGVEQDDLVGICLDGSIEMIVGILGILKAGGAYVPIDPTYPQKRIRFILEDTASRIVLTTEAHQSLFSPNQALLLLDRDRQQLDQLNTDNTKLAIAPHNLAYVIYTSGTTGQPKGVLLEHRNVVRLFYTDRPLFDFGPEEVWVLFHSFCFDFSVWEMYGALLFGGRLVVLNREQSRDTFGFKALLRTEGVTVLNQTPSAFYLLQEQVAAEPIPLELRYVIFGGEALKPAQLAFWKQQYPDCKLVNMYGITETTVHVTYKEITEKEIASGRSNIGVPIPTLSCFVLDEQRRVQPVGVVGELYVGGPGLARAYLNREALTQDRFAPFAINGEVQRFYRTGDLARWLPEGELEYWGRIDSQVKVRGYRIELGEIERRLMQSSQVQHCTVIAHQPREDRNQLIAYVVPKEALDKAQLLEELKAQLPDYMIPAAVIAIDQLPMTASGKLDRKALPKPEELQLDREDFIAPRTATEQRIAAIWQSVLQQEPPFGIKDNFFTSGGDSILLIRVISQLKQAFAKDISIQHFYQISTIEQLGIYFDDEAASTDMANRKAVVVAELEALRNTIWPQLPDASVVVDVYPMSAIQKGMVFASLMNPALGIYHDQFAYHVPAMDLDRLTQALQLMEEKHETFRTAFDMENYGEEVQLIYKSRPVSIGYEDLKELPKEKQEQRIAQFMSGERKRPFTITAAPLWRVDVFHTNEQQMVFVLQAHHAIADGWSVASFNTELYTIYKALEKNPAYRPAPLKASYKTAIIEHRVEQSSPATLSYWQRELADYKRLDIFSQEDYYKKYLLRFEPELLVQLRAVAAAESVGIKAMLYAATLFTLKQFTYENDLTVGMVSNLRPACEDGDKVLGCFLNTLPFRSHIPVDQRTGWNHYFKILEQQLEELKQRNRITLHDLALLKNERTREGNPFFDVLLNFVDFHIYDEIEVEEELSKDLLELNNFEATNTFLDITISTTGNELLLSFSTRKILQSGLPITELANIFERTLRYIIAHPQAMIHHTTTLSESTEQQLLQAGQHQHSDYPRAQSIVEVFSAQVAISPERKALSFEGQQLTYRQLDERSNQMARYLMKQGLGAESLVAVALPRSPELIISILGILKAGAAYVPLNPTLPKERIDYIIQDTDANIVISPALYQKEHSKVTQESTAALPPQAHPDQLAYVIYTSGTTGVPKGVMVSHRNVVSLVKGVDYVQFSSSDVLLSTGAPSFDAVTFEYWGMLLNGGELVLCPEETLLDTFALQARIQEHQCTKMWFTSGWFNELVETNIDLFKPLQSVLTGGEKISLNHVARLRTTYPKLQIINAYGPTENTTFSLIYEVGATVADDIPIGLPLNNRHAYILDQYLRPVPIGVPGELWVGGDGVARAYLNDEQLTNDRFIDNPFDGQSRLYRTGDLARWIPEGPDKGQIAFLGRIDDQVKIRGFRIELGEIETALLRHEHIKQAVVLARPDAKGSKQLVAYLVTQDAYDREVIRQYLRTQLPPYMVPALLVQLEELPLTANGKVDRKALPEPDASALFYKERIAPQNETQQGLADIWQELLNIEELGIHDNFFELGGHSLLAARLSTHLQKQFGIRVPIKSLFEYTTIADLSKYLQLLQMEQERDEDEETFEL
ncbi:MAG: amino acid adenylation domain-containing protein [Bacteroidota bacterium]